MCHHALDPSWKHLSSCDQQFISLHHLHRHFRMNEKVNAKQKVQVIRPYIYGKSTFNSHFWA